MTDSVWTLSEHGTFRAPGLLALIFHNRYPEGKQGGIEIISTASERSPVRRSILDARPKPVGWSARGR